MNYEEAMNLPEPMEKVQHLHFWQVFLGKVDIVQGDMYPLHPFPMKKGFVSMKKIFLKKTCAFIWKK